MVQGLDGGVDTRPCPLHFTAVRMPNEFTIIALFKKTIIDKVNR